MRRLATVRTILFGVALAGAAGTAAAQIPIKFGTPTNGDTVHDGMITYKAAVEKKAPGKVKIDIFPGGQLGSIPNMIEGVQLGTIEMLNIPPEFLVGLDSRFGVVSAPGVFTDMMHGYRTLHEPEFKKAYWALGENKGIKVIGAQCNAEAHYVSRRPIRTLEDFKGRKIRVFASALEREEMSRLGAAATPMPLGEVIQGLQVGTIDAAKSGFIVFVTFKMQAVSKYVLRSRESLICIVQFVNKPWFEKLAPDVQALLTETAIENDAVNMKHTMAIDASVAPRWKEGGGEVNDLSPAEHTEFLQRIATVGETALASDPPAMAMYLQMKQAAERTKHQTN